MTSGLPRGVRNNNPGNIDRTATKWQGMADDQSSDSRFVVFKSPEWGIRALAKTLMTYQDRYGLLTVRGIVGRWAPPAENNTSAYVDHVASLLGVGPGDPINVHSASVMTALVRSIIAHENAGYTYPAAVVAEGVSLAIGTKEAAA